MSEKQLSQPVPPRRNSYTTSIVLFTASLLGLAIRLALPALLSKTGGTVHWPAVAFGPVSLTLNILLDMAWVSLASLAIHFAYTTARFQTARRRQKIQHALWCIFFSSFIAFTYHWCKIDPAGLWNSRGNAWTHLMGRNFSEEERRAIRRDAERAPDYFAQGEAEYQNTQKYLQVPAEQIDAFQRQQEISELKNRLLQNMTAEYKQQLIDEEFARLLDRKKGGYFPPELSVSRLAVYFQALVETITIALWASLIAVIIAIPVSVFAASNTMSLFLPGNRLPARILRWIAVAFVRRFLDACRGFNELVMALIFVSVIGLGPFAGILALCIHTIGCLGKVFSEAVEAVEHGQVEALMGSGARPIQIVTMAVIPQIMPTLISYSLLRFESNVRSAAILGWVGAGGIGFLLQEKMGSYSYREVCTMMIMIIITVTLLDFACSKLRKKFI